MNLKGKSTKGHELYVSRAREAKGEKGGHFISLGLACDRLPEADIDTAPMLVYKQYKDKNGADQTSFDAWYSDSQYESIMAAANTDGDRPVIKGDLMFRKGGGSALIVNTKSLTTPEKPFDYEAHQANLDSARKAKADARAKVEAQEAALAASDDQALDIDEADIPF